MTYRCPYCRKECWHSRGFLVHLPSHGLKCRCGHLYWEHTRGGGLLCEICFCQSFCPEGTKFNHYGEVIPESGAKL